ncbi:nucleoplasmin-like protein NO29 isoform X2 [Folsomia candida]|uniref:nucleoplasmin-like protein NO29 isoform X2 n=1 Tax=Folsomia candida TaxID=158441 RepID=UPI000B8FE27D|nr:nucleoplasmin-like protein NO29 isoform X2 [Folsomia candida]
MPASLNTSVVENGTKILEPAVNGGSGLPAVLQPGLNRRVIFMRKLEVGEGLTSEYKFEPPFEGEDVVQHTVALKRIVLGPDADLTEHCVLELETKIDSGKVEKFPLAYLGKNTLQLSLEMFISENATIRLIRGKGPVFLLGEYAEEWRDDENDEVDESGNEAEEEEEEENDEEIDNDDQNNGVVLNGGLRKRKINKDIEAANPKKLCSEELKDAATEPMDEENKA